VRPFSRRRLLALFAAAASAPWGLRASAPWDVVVIGAGAAGLGASRRLRELGLSVITIEASNRTGGRCHTNFSVFGQPYDLGAHWLHQAETNPFVEYGRRNGFEVYPDPGTEALYVGDREATEDERRGYDRAYRAASAAISSAGRQGEDVSPQSVVPDGGVWHDLVHFVIGPWDMGKDFDAFSCADWWHWGSGSDWFCREGYGTLLQHLTTGTPVELATRAHTIDWGGPGVTVETDRGSIEARACIVTVSTGVLASEAIRFVPALPARKQASFHGISMGVYDHIALAFDRDIFGTGRDGYLFYRTDSHGAASPRLMGLLTNISGTQLSFGDVGGDFAAELEAAGHEAAIAFAREELGRMLGSAADKHFVKGHFTTWGKNPLTRGSYASALPGAYPLRTVLRESIAERVWFSGEACSATEWATVSGAYKHGLETADEVARALARPAAGGARSYKRRIRRVFGQVTNGELAATD